ncbi:hypothetical protein VPH35_109494 [Triticum aestivum]
MADIENPHVDDDNGSVAEAEPAECSRRVYMCLLGCVALALVLAFQSFLHFKESHPAETMLGIMVDLGGLLAALVGGWFVLVFAALVADWFEGNPEGKRLVDNLIESDRPCLLGSFRLVLSRCDPDQHLVDA